MKNTKTNLINKQRPQQLEQNDMQTESALSTPMKWLARAVLILISFVWYSPHVYASVQKLSQAPALNRIENYYPMGAELEQLRHTLKAYLQQKSIQTIEIPNLDRIQELDDELREDMAANVIHLENKQQARAVIERQAQVLDNYEQQMASLYTSLKALTTAKVNKTGQTEAQQEAQNQQQKTLLMQALQSLNTPFSRPHESYGNDLDFIDASPRNIYTSQAQINALLGTDSGNYTGTDTATQVTQAITDKVSELGADPLTLYQWVHDTIRWVPSYGVMQGADYTLQSEQGNAFDTSSLLISLLRAAGHEARYRYGVVQVPVDQIRNWVGNVKNIDAATNIVSQGGIPQTQVNYGGAVEDFRFEHVWVEVKEGTSWHTIDPSFKQYTYTEGMDLESAVSFDAQGLLTQLEASSTSNEAEGWVQGINANLIETELSNYQTQLESYLSTNAPSATLGDVLGLQTIIPDSASTLAEAIPQYEIQLSAQQGQLPETLFHRFQYQVGTSISYDLGQSFSWGSEIFSLNKFTTELVGKDIALSFRPATPADEAAIESYLPDTIEAVDDLPTSLPASGINMIGELTLDGEVVYSTLAVTLGESLKTRIGFISPQRNYKYTENSLVAGQYRAIGIDMQGISPKQLETLQANLENTQTQLEADNTASLTKHDVVGNILQAGIQGYLAMTYATDRIAAQSANVAYHRQPSYGTFGTHMEVSYLITGVPNQVNFTGVMMDVDRLSLNTEEKENCYEGWVAFNRAAGMRNSAYEHQIPEQLFSTDAEQAEGVSTAKALALAMTQGQRIYTLAQDNANQLSNITIDDGARAEIQSALSAGFEVTVHQSPISVNGWTGSGYTILDAEYRAGAYKISGGNSGGFIKALKNKLLKIQFWLGALKSLNKSNVVVKAMTKVFGQILSVFNNAYKFMTQCGSLSNALILTLVFTLISAAIALFLFFITGPFTLFLSFGLAYIEDKLSDHVIKIGC